MKMTISEIAKLSQVSVRTLHYYDEIGLLKPTSVDEHNGYRYYDKKSLEKLQAILFYRELDFSLKEIGNIFSNPSYNKNEALIKQKKLLTLKKERMERLIAEIDNTMRGVNTMNFKSFDNTDFEKQKELYAKEAQEKWGKTQAYKQSQEKTSNYSKDDWNNVNKEMTALMGEFFKCMDKGNAPDSNSAQQLVEKWQNYISNKFYTCTNEIVQGLGQMYIADQRFKENIDKNGSGTAEYMSKAIEIYCTK